MRVFDIGSGALYPALRFAFANRFGLRELLPPHNNSTLFTGRALDALVEEFYSLVEELTGYQSRLSEVGRSFYHAKVILVEQLYVSLFAFTNILLRPFILPMSQHPLSLPSGALGCFASGLRFIGYQHEFNCWTVKSLLEQVHLTYSM